MMVVLVKSSQKVSAVVLCPELFRWGNFLLQEQVRAKSVNYKKSVHWKTMNNKHLSKPVALRCLWHPSVDHPITGDDNFCLISACWTALPVWSFVIEMSSPPPRVQPTFNWWFVMEAPLFRHPRRIISWEAAAMTRGSIFASGETEASGSPFWKSESASSSKVPVTFARPTRRWAMTFALCGRATKSDRHGCVHGLPYLNVYDMLFAMFFAFQIIYAWIYTYSYV